MTGETVAALGESTVPVVPLQSTTEQATVVVTQFAGLAVFAGTLAALSALVYRWASREQIPVGLALLVGLSGVAVYLNTTTVLGQVIAGDTALSTDVGFALFNVGAFLAAGGGAVLGRRAGDRFAADVFLKTGTSDVDEEVNRLVRTVGRVLVVTLPDEVDDVVGYDPVAAETKQKLAGKRFSLSPVAHRRRAQRAAGLAAQDRLRRRDRRPRTRRRGDGHPPRRGLTGGRNRSDAPAGDQRRCGEGRPRVCRERRRHRPGLGDRVHAPCLHRRTARRRRRRGDPRDRHRRYPEDRPRQEYRLVTLPVEDRPEREFASLLRAADETSTAVTVEAGSPLHGLPVGALDLTVVVVKPAADGAGPVALPEDDQVLAPDDTLFVIGRPDGLRRLEQASQPLDPSLVDDVGRPSGTRPSEPATPESSAVGEPILDEQPGEAPSQPAEADDGGVGVEPAANGETGATAEAGANGDTATAGESTFDELKSEFESGEADWEAGDDDEPIESVAGGSGTGESSTDDATTEGESSFDELKAEFESGEADWEDDDEADSSESDDLVGLEDADISFDDDEADDVEFEESDDGIEFEDSGSSFDIDDEGDDLLDLDLDEEDGEELSFEEDGDEDEDSAADDDDDDDSSGGSTFAQLKEEFESGEADWEDEVSDSPGGDMRLDE